MWEAGGGRSMIVPAAVISLLEYTYHPYKARIDKTDFRRTRSASTAAALSGSGQVSVARADMRARFWAHRIGGGGLIPSQVFLFECFGCAETAMMVGCSRPGRKVRGNGGTVLRTRTCSLLERP